VKWTLKLARIAGVDVRVHATFAILLIWVASSQYSKTHDLIGALGGVLTIIAVFSIVVLHELGHALAAKRFGIGTLDITLFPIGGIARLERTPDNPHHELLIAIAGPAVNLVLAALLAIGMASSGELPDLSWLRLGETTLLETLLSVNILLAGFNLLPAFPMDGGRAIRALLSMRMDRVRATNIAAFLGEGMALIFIVLGLFSNTFLIFIGIFVWLGAAAEASATQQQSALAGVLVRDAMITRLQTLRPEQPLADAVNHVLAGFQEDFPVIENGRLVGMLTRENMLRGLAEQGSNTTVAHAMQDRFETTSPTEPLSPAFARLMEHRLQTLPVLEMGRLVGVLTPGNVGEFLMIQNALSNVDRRVSPLDVA
jgi:Zn-dependent protease/CBS domain-containing protein